MKTEKKPSDCIISQPGGAQSESVECAETQRGFVMRDLTSDLTSDALQQNHRLTTQLQPAIPSLQFQRGNSPTLLILPPHTSIKFDK